MIAFSSNLDCESGGYKQIQDMVNWANQQDMSIIDLALLFMKLDNKKTLKESINREWQW